MGSRGRLSKADLAVVPFQTEGDLRRPAPPAELTAEQAGE
jgi:hypothetical protein